MNITLPWLATHERQGDRDQAHHQTVDAEDVERVVAQAAQQPADGDDTDRRRGEEAEQQRQPTDRRDTGTSPVTISAICSSGAARKAGVPSRKLKRAASVRRMPRISPAAIVLPLR